MGKEQTRKRYLLTLYRQGSDLNHKKKDDIVTSNKEGEESFFSTDYFNKLVVEEIKLQNEDKELEDMAHFVGMKNRNYIDSEVIAVHNYAIFQDIDFSEEKSVDSIFRDDISYPYLGLIFVYVTPDVLVGINKKFQDYSYIDYFEDDLKQMIKVCKKIISIKGQVFKMLSASDFMIAVRSKEAEDIYAVSMAIRKRIICKENNIKEALSAYKTYTILTINGLGMTIESKKLNSSKGVVIRGRYSNQYWKNKDYLERNTKKPKGLTNLTGRYDFLLHLKREEFLRIYPYLCRVKGITSGHLKDDNNFLDSEDGSDSVKYLRDLIKGNYLSYLNERYLMGKIVDISDKIKKRKYNDLNFNPDMLTNIFLDSDANTEIFMYEDIEKECKDIIGEINMVKEQFKKLKLFRQSIISSINLLINLVYLCQSVNGLSDARIYVVSLVKQIKVVLASLYTWKEMYEKENSSELIDEVEYYLRKSIISLEAYGSLIRNNNFQTLQSPTYNAVTGISLEKILIGYTHFIEKVMNFYGERLLNHTDNIYLPMMIPTLSQSYLSMEVMFPRYREDRFKISEDEKNPKQHLMVVTSPATSELVNMAIIVTTLFHELAHRLRYEERRTRNNIVFQMILEDMITVLVENFFAIVVEPTNGVENTKEIQSLLFDVLIKVTREKIEEFINPYMELSLEDFKAVAQEKIQEFLDIIQKEDEEIILLLRSFIDDSNEYIKNDEDTMKLLVYISKSIKILTGRLKDERLAKIDDIENIVKAELENKIQKYIEICGNNINTDEKEGILESLQNIAKLLEDNIQIYKCSENNEKQKLKESFYNEIYEKACEKWHNHLYENGNIVLPQNRIWLRQGRKLGIDFPFKNNQDRFQRNFEKTLKVCEQYSFETAMRHIELYREETSDLFMCSTCQLDLTAYLVICAMMYPLEKEYYAEGYIDRMTDVILVQWCIGKEEDIETIDTDDICTQKEFLNVWKRIYSNEEITIKNTKEFSNAIKKYQNQKEISRLKKNVAVLMIQILDKMDSRIQRFKNRKYLLKDYLYGKQKYEAIINNSENSLITNTKNIIKVCREILDSMGDVDIQLRQMYQEQCEMFVWREYYADKIEHTRELEKMRNIRVQVKDGN